MLKSKHIQEKIDNKKAELEVLNDIKRYTEVLTSQLEQLEDKLDEMVDGAESVSLVLSNWQNVMRSILLASLSLHKYNEKSHESKTPMPETLVRIKLDKDVN